MHRPDLNVARVASLYKSTLRALRPYWNLQAMKKSMRFSHKILLVAALVVTLAFSAFTL